MEQARKDIKHGQEDIQSLRSVFMGVASPLSAIVATYFIEIGEPLIPFYIVFIFICLQALQGFFISDEIETNQYATMKDKELLKYEQEQRDKNPFKYQGGMEVERPGICTILSIKFKLMWTGL